MLSSCQKTDRPQKRTATGWFLPDHLGIASPPKTRCLHCDETTKESPVNSSRGRCEQEVKQMWCVWVTLITHRFRRTPVSLVGLFSGHCLKVKGGHCHYLSQANPIIQTMKWALFSQCTQLLSISLGWTHVFSGRANLRSELAVRNVSWSACCCPPRKADLQPIKPRRSQHQNQRLENVYCICKISWCCAILRNKYAKKWN